MRSSAQGLRARVTERVNIVRFVLAHPLNRRRRVRALARWTGWQVWRRVVRKPMVVRFWKDLRVRVYPDWPYSWTAIYFGLTEYDGMLFTLRYLRAGDAFVDVGAHIGIYSVLAASVNAGGAVIAIEPHPTAAARLRENAALNAFGNIQVVEAAASDAAGTARLTSDLFDQNRVETGDAGGASTVEVPMVTLDAKLAELGIRAAAVAFVKVDTEGFEANVLAGARSLLDARPGPVWMLEAAELGERYGAGDSAVHALFRDHGYQAMRYLAEANRIVADDDPAAAYTIEHLSRETIFARRPEDVAARLGATLAIDQPATKGSPRTPFVG